MNEQQRPTHARFVVIFFMVTLAMVTYLDRACIGAMKQHIAADFSLDDAQMGWVFTSFILAYAILRAVNDSVSKERVKFDLPIEIGGRSLLAIWCGWLMVCFVAFSLQMAPLNNATPLGAWSTPQSRTFGPLQG